MNAKQNSRQYPVDKIRLSLVSYRIIDMDKQKKQQEIPSSGFLWESLPFATLRKRDSCVSISSVRGIIMMMVTQHIPTMTDSHPGGFLSVMIMVGICQVTNSHHKWWWRNLFGTIPTKMLITTWSYIYTYYQPPAFHASQTLSKKCQKPARPLQLLYSFNTGHHDHNALAE